MSPPILLNNLDHQDLRITLGHDPAFGDAVNQTLVFPTEYEALQRDYPILFRAKAGGGYHSVVLLGFDRDENLFLEDGRWKARSIPALHQRGPFSIGLPGRDPDGTPSGEPMIHVDLDHPRVTAPGGEPVFLPHGGNAPYLDHVSKVLRSIFLGSEASGPMFAAFERFGLIEPVTLEVDLGNGRHVAIPDCFTIGRERLRGLDGDAAAALHAQGFLQPAMWVASSLGNLAHLIDLKNARTAQFG
ncbi:SapC family protein [Sphingomonas sp. AP4-R1]|uniref:SapC family protein n=1 Tax=Sphingomonas sp. AP4-R1 TaxID=2735134 RepID=UPI0014932E0E|nr:SapC family protein [Sphingomonas sp. AP4-R1]QJU59120.1 SapC family protein [Sphingomonas sp. AP4-R1]